MQIIIYQRSKGNVWYDQDGSGHGLRPVKFAKIDKGLDLDRPQLLRRIWRVLI